MPRRASHSTYTPDSGPNDSTKSPTPWTRCGSKPSMQARRVKPPQWRKSLTNPPNIMKWLGFCFAFIVRRLATLDSYNTRFPPLPVSRSPGAGAAVSSSATRPAGTSPAPGPSDHGRACAARRDRSCTRRRRIRPWRCRGNRRPCRSTAACRIPSPWRAVHRAGVPHAMIAVAGEAVGPARATRPTRSPAPTPAGAAPPCSWWWRTPGPRSAWRTCR